MRSREKLRRLGLVAALGVAWGCAQTGPGTPAIASAGAPDEAAAVAAPAAAAADADAALLADIGEGPSDPLERMNRGFFLMNRGVDWAVLDPLSNAYRFVVPEPGRNAIRRAFDNLNSMAVLANDILQCQAQDAIVTVFRFAINSTIGLAGLFDPASRLGLPVHDSDFGETLYLYGVPTGPYLVLPLLGPTSVRDAVGEGVDGLLRPEFWVLGPTERLFFDATNGISYRESHLDEIRALRDASLDYYAALRSAYWMHRQADLAHRQEVSESRSRSIYEATTPAR
ncbi:MAG TPA: VacJ family lipoprotein [Myxococcota bacterium]|nr:VacJ family lipoprotein [Myxococcota bacterium]